MSQNYSQLIPSKAMQAALDLMAAREAFHFTGVPGIGKSSLLHQAASRYFHASDDWRSTVALAGLSYPAWYQQTDVLTLAPVDARGVPYILCSTCRKLSAHCKCKVFGAETAWALPAIVPTTGKGLWVIDEYPLPELVCTLRVPEVIGCVTHEASHCALLHHVRIMELLYALGVELLPCCVAPEDPDPRKNCQHMGRVLLKIGNIGGDLAINTPLRESGVTLPSWVIFAGEGKYNFVPPNKSLEWYFHHLRNLLDQGTPPPGCENLKQPGQQGQGDPAQDGQPGQQGKQGQQGQQGQQAGQPGQGQGQAPGQPQQPPGAQNGQNGGQPQPAGQPTGQNAGQPGGPGMGRGFDPGSFRPPMNDQGAVDPGAAAENKAQWQAATAEASDNARGRGALPGGLGFAVAEAMQPKTSPWDVLRQFLVLKATEGYSWNRPDRRFIAEGTYLPARCSPTLGTVVELIDHSGSITQTEVDVFNTHVQDVLESYHLRLVILFHTDEVTHMQEWAPGDGPLVLELPKESGGTDHRPAFQRIDDDALYPTCVIAFTDLETRFPEQAPDYPVLWASTKCQRAPFGEIVDMREELGR